MVFFPVGVWWCAHLELEGWLEFLASTVQGNKDSAIEIGDIFKVSDRFGGGFFGAVWLFLDQVQGSLLLLQLVPTRLKDTCCQRLPHFLERICVVPEATMLQMKVVECSLMLGWFWLWHVISAFWGFVLEGSNLTAAKMSRCNLQAVSVSSVFSSRVLSSCRGDKSRTSQIHQGMFWRLGFVNMLLSF